MIAGRPAGSMTFGIMVTIYFGLCGCASDNSVQNGSESKEPDAMQSCSNPCESQLWPRVIVSIRDQNASELTNVRLRAFDQDGTQLPSYLHGCPELPNQYLCTYGVHGPGKESELKLYFDNEVEEVSAAVALGPQNHCGRELAYLSVLSSLERRLTIHDVRYISPCLNFDVP